MKRKSGVLMHISSLWGDYSEGSFGKEAIEWVDFLAAAGFSVWQVLPFCLPDEYNSPYKSFGAFSINPYFIDPSVLASQGLLTQEELRSARQQTPYSCEFDRLHQERMKLLALAASRVKNRTPIKEFLDAHPQTAEFCRYMTQNGILVSAGHTNAIYDDMKTAEQNGCKLITHLYSCTSTITRECGFRRLGVIESAFLSDDLYVEIIADGRHLPHELIKLILKIKGTGKVALVTDSLEIAGTDIKEGGRSGSQFIVEDGVCKLYDRSAFAGSVALADRLIRVILECGLSLCEAVKMMTRVPAEILGLNKGTLAQGYDADVIVFDDGINVSDAFVMGKKVI